MLLLRLIAIITALAIGVNLLLWIVTGNQRYYHWALKSGKFAFIASVLTVGLLLAERLIVL